MKLRPAFADVRDMKFRFAIVVLALSAASYAAEIKGKVTNAVGGEALGRVEVVVLENKLSTVTAIGGEFDIPNLAPGGYTLRLNAVGYRLLIVPFTLGSAAEVKEFSITMVPDNFHHTDKVEVHGDVFQLADSPATSRDESDGVGDSRDLDGVRRRSVSRSADACREFRRKGTTNSLRNFR